MSAILTMQVFEGVFMRKQDIADLFQNEDRTLDFLVKIEDQFVTDVVAAIFVVNTLEGTEQFRYTLSDNILFDTETSIFTVNLKDTETSLLTGKYNYELWFRDSLSKDLMPFYGSLKFKSTFARY